MARTPSVSDQQILDAADKVFGRRGADGFTLSEVASEVNLSRAAIILRFKSTEALKVTLMRRQLKEFSQFLENCPCTPGGDQLLELAAKIGEYVGSRESFSTFMTRYSDNIKDTELAVLEFKRGIALSAAVAKVMPQTAIDHKDAVTAFTAHLTGTIMAWPWTDETSPRQYTVKRTILWMRMAGISFSETKAKEQMALRNRDC